MTLWSLLGMGLIFGNNQKLFGVKSAKLGNLSISTKSGMFNINLYPVSHLIWFIDWSSWSQFQKRHFRNGQKFLLSLILNLPPCNLLLWLQLAFWNHVNRSHHYWSPCHSILEAWISDCQTSGLETGKAKRWACILESPEMFLTYRFMGSTPRESNFVHLARGPGVVVFLKFTKWF